jgi:DNA repair exonuclease SbcCD ATPase subunit/DNA repair exonuclease SbcCD nuclease subunit
MKFAHIADTHIKNLKYHYEYKIVFEKLYQALREEKVDYIIHCGDIAHTKTQLSPEFVELCSHFLSQLADIAPTYVILGNHDGNLKNSNRQDAITPIVEALDNPNLFLLKNSGEEDLDGSYSLNVLSVFDRDNWVPPSDRGKINIALYHGAISNSRTDLGWVMEHGEDDLSIFEGHDFAFLGDIHKTNQTLDHKGKIRYAGSTVQQNHGETNDKGFLIWEIKDRDTFTCTHHVLENPRPFITIELTPKGRLPKNTAVPPQARLRLVSNNNLSLDAMKKAVEIAKHRFKPEHITFLNRAAGTSGNVEDMATNIEADNLRDPVVQKKLIREYLKDFQPEDELMERVLKLNSKYNSLIEDKEEIHRNINWRLEHLEWDNLFNYGANNGIDFTKFSGIVGVFGKNFSGKSSIVDSALYTLFNSTSKNERKNLNIINQNKDSGRGSVTVSIGNKRYSIVRETEKYIKKLKGEETIEAKTDLNFEVYDEVTDETISLNGLTRSETDQNIRKYFGSMDDFLLTSMSSQLGSLAFISEGSTKRKEILAKFLDLEMFDIKHKAAKDDASDLRGALKRLDGRDFNEEITQAYKHLLSNENETKRHTKKCATLKKDLGALTGETSDLTRRIDAIPAEIINVNEIHENLAKRIKDLEEIIKNLATNGMALKEDNDLLDKITSFVDVFDIEEVKEKQEIIEAKRKEFDEIINEVGSLEIQRKNQEKKSSLLKEVPCGSEYSHCKFIKDAYVAVDNLSITQSIKESLENKKGTILNEIEKLNPTKVEEYQANYNSLLEKKQTLDGEILNLSLKLERDETQKSSLEKEIDDLKQKEEEYNENKEIIEGKEALVKQLTDLQIASIDNAKDLEECEQELLELYKEHGSLEQKVTSLEEQKEELLNLRGEYAAYDLFMRCTHSNGISYDIIKKKLPVINNEIAKVLANVVEFEVFFENAGRHLKIYIKHPRHEPRPLEMGSGAEKTIAAMAIRLALLTVSNLPKSDLFILDEPGTALDADNMEGFISILELVKSYFKTVLLISHLDSLKDCVDKQITIEKQDGYALVSEV